MKEKLLATASKLNQPSSSAADEFSSKQTQLATMGSQILSQRPDVEKLVGKGNLSMSEDNNRNFASFMVSLFSDYSPDVFLETVLWVFRTYRSHGFKATYWSANLNIWVDMMNQELTKDTVDELYPFYNWIIVNIPIFTALTDADLSAPENN